MPVKAVPGNRFLPLRSNIFLIANAFKIVEPSLVADFALSSEEVSVILERKLENKIFLHRVLDAWRTNCVAQKRQWRKWDFVLVAFVEE